MLAKGEFIAPEPKPFVVKSIKDQLPPPPDEPERQVKPEIRQKVAVDQPKPIIEMQKPTELAFEKLPDIMPVYDPGPIGAAVADPIPAPLPQPEPVPVPEPVRKDAQFLASSELQPPYPASEQRAENEGSVTVRVLIGTDGRVKSVEKVRGTNDAFFRATQQQALRHWRFKPATVDGKPVEAHKTMTVHFRLMA
jgi:protein TonB